MKDDAVLAALGYQAEQPALEARHRCSRSRSSRLWSSRRGRSGRLPRGSRFEGRGVAEGSRIEIEARAAARAIAGAVPIKLCPPSDPASSAGAGAPDARIGSEAEPCGCPCAVTGPTTPSRRLRQFRRRRDRQSQTPRNPQDEPRSSTLATRTSTLEPRRPSSPRTRRFQLALYHQRAGDFEQALLHYKAALQRDEMNVEAHNNLGCLYLGRNLLEEAAREFQRVHGHRSRYAPAQVNLSATLYKLGRFDAAAAHAREALENRSAQRRRLVNLALAQKASGQQGSRRGVLRRALELNPRQRRRALQPGPPGPGDAAKSARAVEHYRQFLQYAGPRNSPTMRRGRPAARLTGLARPESANCTANMSEIDALLKEDRRFPPTEAWRRNANINDPGVYAARGRRSGSVLGRLRA